MLKQPVINNTTHTQVRAWSMWQKMLATVIVVVGIGINLMFISLSIKWGCEFGKCGLWIGEWHYHDALWHIAVSRISFNSLPFIFPSAAGFELSSYNYLLGLILFLFERIRISAFTAYFYILPLFANGLFLHALMRYMRVTGKSPVQQIWICFFSYLASSLSYFLIFYTGDPDSYSVLKGFPVVTTLQPSIVLSNIQFYLSLSFFIYIFTDVVVGDTSRRTILVHILLLALCIGLKIYTGILTIIVLTAGYLYWGFQKKSIKYLYHLALLALVSVIAYFTFYFPGSSHTQSIPFVFSLLSIPHTLTESQNLFYSESFTLGRYYMIGLGRWSPRLFLYEGMSVFFFVCLNLGARIVLVAAFFRDRFTLEKGLLLIITILGFLIPIFYIQDSGGWYNTIQFAYISTYTAGFLASFSMARLAELRFHKVAMSIMITVVLLSVPNTLFTLRFATKEKILISDQQLRALSILHDLPNGIVLSLPDKKNSSYVPALAGKQGYLIDDEQGALLRLPIKDRRKSIDLRECKVLLEIDYLYLNNEQGREFLNCAELDRFKKIYQAEEILIYKRLSLYP